MAYLKGEDRRQYILFTPCLDEFIGEDAPVRLFDAFVDQINMEKLGILATPTCRNRYSGI